MQQRVKALQQILSAKPSLHGALAVIARPSDITYFTGFEFLTPLDQEREAYLVISPESAHLIYASFSPIAKQPWLHTTAGASPQSLKQVVQRLMQQEKLTHIAADIRSLFVDEYQALQAVPSATIIPFDRAIVWNQRMRKDEDEIAALTIACSTTSQVITSALNQLTEGMTELALRDLIEAGLRAAGCTGLSFPSIICFGEHAALPHHQPTTTPLKPETAVLIDVGGSFKGYRADMTRTVWFGQHPSKTFSLVKAAVHDAYQAAWQVACLAGNTHENITAKDIDTAARSVIGDHGYGDQFIHTTGHGVGLDIHEPPSLSWRNDQSIQTGMTLTIEPGIYIPGEFGYRYENTVLITESGCKTLTLESTESELDHAHHSTQQ